jgi:hypothetical protein
VIDAPGLYTMSAEEYHADPCPTPSLSSSIAKILISRSPLHAWTEHARLNPAFVPEEKATYDRGSAAHALLLEGEDRMVVIEANDYRKAAAQEARDAARAAGKHPVLVAEYPNILKMRDVALASIAACGDLSGMTLADGKAEPVLIWREGEIWCRARLDWLADDRRVIFDYKTTTNANPEDWVRTMAGLGGEIQCSFYRRGNEATGGPSDTKFIFGVQECEPPFAMSFIGMPPSFIDLGDSKVAEAIASYARCLTSNHWPAYSDRICWVEPPTWHVARWAERQEAAGIPYDIEKLWGPARGIARESDPALS